MSDSLIFYFGSGSPYAWKVWLALEHKKLRYEARRTGRVDETHRSVAVLREDVSAALETVAS